MVQKGCTLVKMLAGSVTSVISLNHMEVFFFCIMAMIHRIIKYEINSMPSCFSSGLSSGTPSFQRTITAQL